MDMGVEAAPEVEQDTPTAIAHRLPSYFRHPEYAGWNLAHTLLMLVAWVAVMPVAIMLSIARSRYHLPVQVVFHVLNGLGVFTAVVYNNATPDLYENNAHHPIGWVLTSFTIVWTLMSFYVAYGEYKSSKRASLSHRSMAQHAQYGQYNDVSPSRLSRDSGQGTERNSTSLFGGSRQNSSDSVYQKKDDLEEDADLENDFEKAGDNDAEPERRGFLGDNRVDRFISKNVMRFFTQRASKVVRFLQIVLEKFLLLLGFTAIMTGFITSGGIFRDRQVFSGAAHFVKGGIFFWYGMLTLGRWMGAFTEFGWAWNVRPPYPLVAKWKSRVPSAEFTESFVIWLYGASNVFLEHLNNWGTKWTASDIEHVSITILFFGGGMLGMLVESEWGRELLNTTVIRQKQLDRELAGSSRFGDVRGAASHSSDADDSAHQRWQQPITYRFSLNPMPALTIMLLGMMMSGHVQHSMVSTMMHAQWGGLFTAFAIARAVTYVTLYITPPASHFPSRPPSELVAAFCLTSGGLLFMMSASDGVWAIESNGLDAMTIFTLTMGLTGVVLAYEVVVFALKGWAVRKERAAVGKPLA